MHQQEVEFQLHVHASHILSSRLFGTQPFISLVRCCVTFVAVFVPPGAAERKAEEVIIPVVSELETSKPDARIIVLGDFNSCSALPRQYVTFATIGKNQLDLCHCNLPQAYQAKKRHTPSSCIPKLKTLKTATRSEVLG